MNTNFNATDTDHNIIEITNLRKEYKSAKDNKIKVALDDLNLIVRKGSILGLLGPNGAGKSTLINILAGTVNKTSGSVSIAGISIDEQPKRARYHIGVVPQEIYYDTFFSLYQALELYAGYYGIRPQDRKSQDILKALSLWDKKDSLPQQLSGGMKRRFLIAKAMIHSPAIIILDEPTAGVDLELRNQLWSYVKELNNRGVTIIITTHYLTEAEEMCNDIAFINNGKIIKQSTVDELLSEFSNRYIDVEFRHSIELSDELRQNQSITILDEKKIRFNLDIGGENYLAILKQIEKVNIPIKDIKTSVPHLEDVFYKVINNSK